MKHYSPILLFFIALIFISCRENMPVKKESAATDSLEHYMRLSHDSKFSQERQRGFSNKAYRIGIESKNDSLLYKGLYNKIEQDLQYNSDSSRYYLNKLKTLALKIKKEAPLGGYYYLYASYFLPINIDSSFAYYDRSKTEYLKANDSMRAGYSLLMMTDLQRISSDYYGAETTATAALACLKNSGEESYLVAVYNYLGVSYKQLFNYENALKYYRKAYQTAKDSLSKDVVMNNIALIYMDQKEYGKAIKILTKLVSKKNSDTDIEFKAKAIDNLGYSYFLLGDKRGSQYMLQALHLKDSIRDEFGSMASCLHLSEYYLHENPQLARKYAEKAYSLANKLKNTDDKLDAIKFLSKTSASKQESDKLFSEYTTLNDSIRIVRQKAKNQFAKIRYDSKQVEEESLKYQAENAENKLKAEKAKRRNELLLLTISFIVLVGILFYRLLKSRHEKEKFQEAYNTETRIAKKVHDELANDVYNAMTFASTQNLEKPEKKEALIHSLDSVYLRTRDISRENSPIELGENFPNQLKIMLSEYQNQSLNVLIKDIDSVDWIKVDENKKLVTYRVLQELMVNMKKHSQATLAVIDFSTVDKKIQIQYSDNGIGMPFGKTILKNGLQNVENRIKSIRGTLIFDIQTNRGVKLSFGYPV
ncbi:signal transduction histidine kinase [Flavobacterium sp. 28YEA47A]|uniref:tetratricopeptide repeat-containing sensor histidine kinase n=1 Tax=Flavobacterium sp. 28YEA47A TaxID=3156276 RepID=UPI003518717B